LESIMDAFSWQAAHMYEHSRQHNTVLHCD